MLWTSAHRTTRGDVETNMICANEQAVRPCAAVCINVKIFVQNTTCSYSCSSTRDNERYRWGDEMLLLYCFLPLFWGVVLLLWLALFVFIMCTCDRRRCWPRAWHLLKEPHYLCAGKFNVSISGQHRCQLARYHCYLIVVRVFISCICKADEKRVLYVCVCACLSFSSMNGGTPRHLSATGFWEGNCRNCMASLLPNSGALHCQKSTQRWRKKAASSTFVTKAMHERAHCSS